MASESVRSLPVKLTEKEHKERFGRLNQLLDREDSIEDRRRDAVNTANEELKEVRAEISSLRNVTKTGIEHREVAIEERKDIARRVLEVFRLDTLEVIDSRHLSMEECQGDLPFSMEVGERTHTFTAKDNVVPFNSGEPATRAKMEEVEAPSSPAAGGSSSRKRRRANVPEPESAPPSDEQPTATDEPERAPPLEA